VPDTDAVVLGRAAGRETALALADHAATGINPISDVRGSAAFRRELLRRQVLVLWERLFPEGR
jgi:CO/xanthine dehydrogenase FAD-binding subunit